jgi:hypothetical protein
MKEESSKIKNFRDLDVWKLGMEIVVDIYECTKIFPKEEIYSLVSQMRRSAVSIASNIAEGFNRYHNHGYKPQSKLRSIIPSASRDCSTYQFPHTSLWKLEFHE